MMSRIAGTTYSVAEIAQAQRLFWARRKRALRRVHGGTKSLGSGIDSLPRCLVLPFFEDQKNQPSREANPERSQTEYRQWSWKPAAAAPKLRLLWKNLD
jgi:hypothetical protein